MRGFVDCDATGGLDLTLVEADTVSANFSIVHTAFSNDGIVAGGLNCTSATDVGCPSASYAVM